MGNKEQNTGMSLEQLAQWVIDNRYPKSEKEKVSDFEMYHTIVDWQSSQPINSGWASVETIPTEQEINNLVESDLPNSSEYQKYDKEIQSLLMAATKAGAKWFRNSLIEGSYK
jgi:hypothetical protein